MKSTGDSSMPGKTENPRGLEGELNLNSSIAERVELQLTEQDPMIKRQVDGFFVLLEERWRNRNVEGVGVFSDPLGFYSSEVVGLKVREIVDWTKHNFEWIVLSRIQRAHEVAGESVGKARELASKFHGSAHSYLVTCMDGRNLPVVMMSQVPRLGGAIRTRAGEIYGFPDEPDGKAHVNEKSFIAKAIRRLVGVSCHEGEDVYWSLDSHLGCAAKGQSYSAEGGPAKDGGALDDVRRKMRIARGAQKYVEEMRLRGEKLANFVPQTFSYDPHDGSIWMGLEMNVENVNLDGFTHDNLEELRQQGDALNTWTFLEDQNVLTALKELNLPEADFRGKFGETLLANWKAITALYDEGNGAVYQTIYKRIKAMYLHHGCRISDKVSGGHLIYGGAKVIYQGAIENKAKVMLKNLVTRWSIARDLHHEWPFGEHGEQGVVITEGGFAPFPKVESDALPDTFSVFSGEETNQITEHLKLALKLVRAFREKGSIGDPMEQLEADGFRQAPIIVKNHGVVRELPEVVWESLGNVDYNQLFGSLNWNADSEVYEWTKDEFSKRMQSVLGEASMKINDYAVFIDGAYALFDRFRKIISEPELRSMAIKGKIVLANMLVDENRMPRILLPMAL
jgi:hypothetical protein